MRNLFGIFAVLLLTTAPSQATDHVWLIGGGPNLENSQAQIEQNVLWAREIIASAPGERMLHVYFTDGDNPAKDITEWRRPGDTPATLQPLARVFDSYWTNGEHYRNHRLGKVAGGTEAGVLTSALTREFKALGPGDRALIVFNGHGTHDSRDPSRNTISLWNSTWMTVEDVDSLFSHLHPEVSVRFVFTQCYAGAFGQLARAGSNRCGFLAEAEDRPAEGCSASVDLGDYQDYSTYFLAALAGKDRQGNRLVADPDRDGDGAVTLREAHLYTLLASGSSDLPRSTSEVYLEQWLPWYLRWAKWLSTDAATNEYAVLFQELAATADLEAREDLASELQTRGHRLGVERSRLERAQGRLSREIPVLRDAMEREVLERWPEAGHVHTANYRRFLERDLSAAQHHIVTHEHYGKLAAKQNKYWELERTLIENQRAITRLERIQRLAHLARVRALFEDFATTEQKRRYQQLLTCEEQEL